MAGNRGVLAQTARSSPVGEARRVPLASTEAQGSLLRLVRPVLIGENSSLMFGARTARW